jgi:hypothetical protein
MTRERERERTRHRVKGGEQKEGEAVKRDSIETKRDTESGRERIKGRGTAYRKGGRGRERLFFVRH